MGAANYDHINAAEIQLSQLAVWATLTFEAHNSQAKKKQQQKNAPFTSIIQQTHTREKKRSNGLISQISLWCSGYKYSKDFFFFSCSSAGEEERIESQGQRFSENDGGRFSCVNSNEEGENWFQRRPFAQGSGGSDENNTCSFLSEWNRSICRDGVSVNICQMSCVVCDADGNVCLDRAHACTHKNRHR